MRQKCLLLFLILTLILPLKVSAEQAAAEQYRQMFKSGNFYVEYQVFNTQYHRMMGTMAVCALAAENGRRMERTMGKGNIGYGRGILNIPGISGEENRASASVMMTGGGVLGIGKKRAIQNPEVLYQNGKYYRFQQNNTARVLSESELNKIDLNPDEEWNFVQRDMSFPDELAVFCWNDKFHYNPNNTPEPKYNGSSKRTVDNKEYDCDQYVNYIVSLANTNIAMEAYNVLYQNGQLKMIQKYFIKDGKETLVRKVEIKNITSQVPPTAFKMAKKIKVYAAGNGDMNDLLGQPVQVETLGGDSNAK